MISMNQDGEGTLTPSDDAAYNAPSVPPRRQAAASAGALLRGAGKNAVAAAARSPQKPPSARVLKHAAARQYYAQQKVVQQHQAHQRLEDHRSQMLQPPAATAGKAGPATPEQKAAQGLVAKRLAAETKAVREMENRIAGDLTSAFKCSIGSNCLERGLVDAERAAEKLFARSSGSAGQHKQAASHLHNLGQKFKKPSGYRSSASVWKPSKASALAAPKNFWKEAAEIAEKGPSRGPTPRKIKNSAKTFVKQLAAVVRDEKAAHAETPVIPAISTGPMSNSKSKTFR
jgi:hypothetical protein